MSQTVLIQYRGESMSAGRLYDRIGGTAKGVVKYVLPQGVLCEMVTIKREEEEEPIR